MYARLLTFPFLLWFAPCVAGCASAPVSGSPAATRPFGKDSCTFYVTGIGGKGPDARGVMTGLRAAGYEGELRVHDWTGRDWPLAALWNRRRQQHEGRRLARDIRAWRQEHGDARVIIIAHSGGAGVALRALEALPAGNHVDSVVFLAPAVSPSYDLTRALRRVASRLTVFTSRHDVVVLGIGTSLVGTADGVHGPSAGLTGFRRPARGNPVAYRKLWHAPHRGEWLAYGNRGGHYGACSETFSAHVLAPVLRDVAPDTTFGRQPQPLLLMSQRRRDDRWRQARLRNCHV